MLFQTSAVEIYAHHWLVCGWHKGCKSNRWRITNVFKQPQSLTCLATSSNLAHSASSSFLLSHGDGDALLLLNVSSSAIEVSPGAGKTTTPEAAPNRAPEIKPSLPPYSEATLVRSFSQSPDRGKVLFYVHETLRWQPLIPNN